MWAEVANLGIRVREKPVFGTPSPEMVIGEAVGITVDRPTLPIGIDTVIGAGRDFPRGVLITAIEVAIPVVIPADIVRPRPRRRRNRPCGRR